MEEEHLSTDAEVEALPEDITSTNPRPEPLTSTGADGAVERGMRIVRMDATPPEMGIPTVSEGDSDEDEDDDDDEPTAFDPFEDFDSEPLYFQKFMEILRVEPKHLVYLSERTAISFLPYLHSSEWEGKSASDLYAEMFDDTVSLNTSGVFLVVNMYDAELETLDYYGFQFEEYEEAEDGGISILLTIPQHHKNLGLLAFLTLTRLQFRDFLNTDMEGIVRLVFDEIHDPDFLARMEHICHRHKVWDVKHLKIATALKEETGRDAFILKSDGLVIETYNGHSENKTDCLEIVWQNFKPYAHNGYKIRFYVPHGKKVERRVWDQEKELRIFIWSGPDVEILPDGSEIPGLSRATTTPATMFGFKTGCTDSSFTPPDNSVRLLDRETMYVPCFWVTPFALFIPFDAIHKGTPDETSIFNNVMKLAMSAIEFQDFKPQFTEHFKKFIGKNIYELLGQSQEEFTQSFIDAVVGDEETLLKHLESAQGKILQIREQMANALRTYKSIERRMVYRANNESEFLDEILNQIELLKNNPKIINYVFANKRLMIFTKRLYAKDPKTKLWHVIGRFRIDIMASSSLDSAQLSSGSLVRFHNLDRRIDAHSSQMHAPHIFQAGDACFGNWETVVTTMFTEHQFGALAGLLIDFISEVNRQDSAGVFIDRWPEASPKELPEYHKKQLEMPNNKFGQAKTKFLEEYEEILLGKKSKPAKKKLSAKAATPEA